MEKPRQAIRSHGGLLHLLGKCCCGKATNPGGSSCVFVLKVSEGLRKCSVAYTST